MTLVFGGYKVAYSSTCAECLLSAPLFFQYMPHAFRRGLSPP